MVLADGVWHKMCDRLTHTLRMAVNAWDAFATENIFCIALIKLIFKTWWMKQERKSLISQSLWSSCVTTPLYSVSRLCQYLVLNFKNDILILFFQPDSGDPGNDHSWRDHHYDWHWGIFPFHHLHLCLQNSGNWLGCLRSLSHLQHPLLCSPPFTGDQTIQYLIGSLCILWLQVNLLNINEKLVVFIFGSEINLVTTRGQTCLLNC